MSNYQITRAIQLLENAREDILETIPVTERANALAQLYQARAIENATRALCYLPGCVIFGFAMLLTAAGKPVLTGLLIALAIGITLALTLESRPEDDESAAEGAMNQEPEPTNHRMVYNMDKTPLEHRPHLFNLNPLDIPNCQICGKFEAAPGHLQESNRPEPQLGTWDFWRKTNHVFETWGGPARAVCFQCGLPESSDVHTHQEP